jgi:hypothetical protein
MNDEALEEYHDIPALDLDNEVEATVWKVVTAWKDQCEAQGYIDLKQKRCTWVCFICLLRVFCNFLRLV